MSARQLVVCDIEATGLSYDAIPLEIAAVNVATGEELHLVPFVTMTEIGRADPKALQINRYFERGIRDNMLSPEVTKAGYVQLAEMLRGNTFGGSNPRFDSDMLRGRVTTVWHHRLADLAAYAAPYMYRPPTDLPGLADVCQWIGFENTEPHSALGDARATAACFRELAALYRTVDWTDT
jgi:DNA polymerase-3 subunit epsilon